MSLSLKKQKDSAMAALMKAKGITRTSCNCPICHRSVSLPALQMHLATCKGR